MLDDLLRLVRAERGPLLSAAFVGVLLGCMFGWSLDRVGARRPRRRAAKVGPSPTPTLPPLETRAPDSATDAGPAPGVPASVPTSRVPDETAEPEPRTRRPSGLKAALEKGVRDAEAMGGIAEAAVIVGDGDPVFAGSASREMRMWSMSKPVTAIAAAPGDGGHRHSAGLDGRCATRCGDAITKSENCPQRRVVIGLKALNGGSSAKARQAFRSVLDAGRRRRRPYRARTRTARGSVATATCKRTPGAGDPLQPAPQFGVSTWTVVDAARFASALGQRRYGAPGEQVLELMRRPKGRSTELTTREDYTADSNWGAGRVFSGQNAAYKAGWGGTKQGKFMAGQIVTFAGRDGVVALAAMFHPSKQPDRDDPGQENTAAAIEAIMRAVKPKLVG